MPEDSTTPPSKHSKQPNHLFQIKGSKSSRQRNVRSEIPVLDESFLMMWENVLAASFIFSDSVLVFVTSLFESITGYPREQLLSKNFLDFVHPDSMALVKSKWFVRSDEPLAPEKFEVKLIDRSGQTKWLECSATRVIFRGRMSVWCTGYDVTPRKKTEMALKAKERGEDFLTVSKMESLVVLAGGIAHDFNNFLTAMISNITLSKQELDPESEPFAFLSDAEKAAYEAKELTTRLMTFANRHRSEKKTVDLPDLIKRSAQFMLTGSNVDCEFIFPADLWSVEVDVGQFNQVIDNLVINAMQAMPNGGTVVIKAENVHDKSNRDEKFVRVMIRDHGVGIPEKNLSKIFDPYFTTKKNGTGFGLATCYSIVKRHDGELTVSSVVGKGTVVAIKLPVSKELTHVSTENKGEEKKKSANTGKKILLMDDEEKVLSGTGKMLKRMGYDVYLALEGEEAVRLYEQALARKEPFDIVVMDLTVSGGLGATEIIRKLKSIDVNVKSILSSGYFNDPAMKNYQELGFDGQIAKPYRVKELSLLINQIISSAV